MTKKTIEVVKTLMEKSEQDSSEKTEKIEFKDHQGILKNITTCEKLGFNIALRGPTGTGKTFLVKELAKSKGKNLTILNMTTHTTTEEIKGKWVVRGMKNKETNDSKNIVEWVKGAVVKTMENGDWLCIEEANFMNEELASVFYSVMDDRREIIVDEHDGEVVKAQPEFKLFLTMNWDYKGTTRFNPAIMNRVNAWFDLEYLPPKEESKLLVERTGIDSKTALNISEFAQRTRSQAEEDGLNDLSTRSLIKWATLIKEGLDPIEAAKITVVPTLVYGKEEQKKIIDTIKIAFGCA